MKRIVMETTPKIPRTTAKQIGINMTSAKDMAIPRPSNHVSNQYIPTLFWHVSRPSQMERFVGAADCLLSRRKSVFAKALTCLQTRSALSYL